MEEELLWDIYEEAADGHQGWSSIPTTASPPPPPPHHHHISKTIDRVLEADMINALVHQTPPSYQQTTTTTDLFVSKTPWPGYVCRRCHEPGHYIKYCPTNGDPDYDIKEVKRPSGIPMSMLKADPEGSYKLPNGAVAVVEPDEATFNKEMEGLPTTNPRADDLPPELHCPLCNQVMRDASITRKCCFNTFCDKCIRDHIINSRYSSTCFCGAEDVLTDDIIPNLTIRELIARLLESSSPLLITATTTTGSSTSWSFITDHKRKLTDQEQYDHDHPSKRQRGEREIACNYQALGCIN